MEDGLVLTGIVLLIAHHTGEVIMAEAIIIMGAAIIATATIMVQPQDLSVNIMAPHKTPDLTASLEITFM